MEEIKATVKYETHKTGSWVLCILSFIMGVALVVVGKSQIDTFVLCLYGILLSILIISLVVLQICYVKAAKDVAASALQFKIEEEKRRQEETKKSVEDKKYEMSGMVTKVMIVERE